MVVAIGVAVGVLTLETLDGFQTALSNYEERRGTVLVFMSSRCPVTVDSIDAINRTHERYRQREVLFVGLVANDEETNDEIRAFCQRRGVRFPVYRDRGGAVAKRLGAEFTPQAFLVDNNGVLVYRGGFGSDEAASDLSEALGCLGAGRPLPREKFVLTGTPIDEAGSAQQFDDPYGTMAFSSELIFNTIPWAPAHHCSTLTETANGDLVCVWYGGSYESADDQVLFLSRREKDQRIWSAPVVLVKGPPMHPPGNAIVFRVGPQRVGLLWGRMDATRPIRRGGGWGDCQLMYRYSDDGGHTWTEDQEMDGLSGCLPRNAPIPLQDHAFAAPLSGHRGKWRGPFLLVTQDDGLTWKPRGVMNGGSQPTVIQREDGSLLALLRSRPRILESESTDGGQTWSPTDKMELNCPSSGIAMCRLDNGHLVLVHNDTPGARTPLSVRRSLDEGATWEDSLELESNPGEYSYPCVIQTSDGMIHITYTFRRYAIKHVEFNEDWLVHFDRPN